MKKIHTWMLRAMPDCHQATDASWRVVHGKPVQLSERAALESHLLACPACRSYRKRLKWLRRGVADLVPQAGK